MVRSTSKFVCQQCGYSQVGWAGKCPNCDQWGSLVETVTATGDREKGRGRKRSGETAVVELSRVKESTFGRISTGMAEVDRVLGGGFVPGQVILLAGEPGIGKSTLLSQMAEVMYPFGKLRAGPKTTSKNIFYVSGEESAGQIKLRTKRLGLTGIGVFIVDETDVDLIVENIESGPTLTEKFTAQNSLIVVDSIQTLSTTDLTGAAGSVGQVRESASRLASCCKRLSVPLVMVGHVIKDGSIAGPRVLEHMVDTVLWFEGDRASQLRILRTIKNRFGPTDEIGVFAMGERGLEPVADPSAAFVSGLKHVPGQVWTVVLEGTRPLLVELQALVVPTKLVIPRRVVQGVDPRRVDMVLAVLTRRAGVPLGNFDVFVNAVGGLDVREPAADLAIALAIWSAWANQPLGGTCALGEIGLLGEVRPVIDIKRRIRESTRLGKRVLISPPAVRTVGEAIRKFK